MRRLNLLVAMGLAVLCGLVACSSQDAHAPAAGFEDPSQGAIASRRAALPRRFHLFGWLSPPPQHLNAASVAAMKEAGLDLLLPHENDRGLERDNLRRLDLAAQFGMQCMLVVARLDELARVDDATQADTIMQRIVNRYREHPGFFGYYLGDEPRADVFAKLEVLHASLRAHDPEHPAWNNLFGRLGFRGRSQWLDYTREYRDRVKPAVLCNDHYEFMRDGDRGQFIENAAGLCALAREAGLPAWGIVQLVEHGDYRPLSAGELKWQVSMWLAYGATGIGYFTYWTPAPNPRWNFRDAVIRRDGSRTAWYGILAGFNGFVRAAGERLATLEWQSTMHSGSVPRGAKPFSGDDLIHDVEGRAAVSRFADAEGRPYVLVANSDSLAAQTISLSFRDERQWSTLDEAHPSWADAPDSRGRRAELVLGAGSLAILRFDKPHGDAG